MVLKSYYEDLSDDDKLMFIQLIREQTGKSKTTVKRWINGDSIPKRIDQRRIAIQAGICIDIMFPK